MTPDWCKVNWLAKIVCTDKNILDKSLIKKKKQTKYWITQRNKTNPENSDC